MSLDSFDFAFAYTVGNEGSYSNDPADRGGPTKYGITITDLSRWLRRPASVQEVKDLSLGIAKKIYFRSYFTTLALDRIENQSVATCMFDIGVVRGIFVSAKYAQTVCNLQGEGLAVDGHIGPLSIIGINDANPKTFVTAFSSLAEQGFREIVKIRPSQEVFLNGWVKRAERLLTLV